VTTSINYNNLENKPIAISAGSLIDELQVQIPGSKSLTNRALLMSAFANGTSRIYSILESEDTRRCIECLESLGFQIKRLPSDGLEIEGMGGEVSHLKANLYLGAAGTLARFLPGLLAASPSAGRWKISGDHSLTKRPQREILSGLIGLGAKIECLETENLLPIEVYGNTFIGGKALIDGSRSSQFVSGMIMAAPLGRVPSEILVSGGLVQHEYVTMTQDLMERFGVNMNRTIDGWQIDNNRYHGTKIEIEADISSAAYFFALAALHGQTVSVTNMPQQTRQPDKKILEALALMGCKVDFSSNLTSVTGPKKLRGNLCLDLTEYSDQALTLGILGAACDGPIEIRGINHIQFHESNRIESLANNLARVGIQTQRTNSGIIIFPGKLSPGVINPQDDHRVAMSFALLGSKFGNITIQNPNCTAKTFPSFFSLLERSGIRLEVLST